MQKPFPVPQAAKEPETDAGGGGHAVIVPPDRTPTPPAGSIRSGPRTSATRCSRACQVNRSGGPSGAIETTANGIGRRRRRKGRGGNAAAGPWGLSLFSWRPRSAWCPATKMGLSPFRVRRGPRPLTSESYRQASSGWASATNRGRSTAFCPSRLLSRSIRPASSRPWEASSQALTNNSCCRVRKRSGQGCRRQTPVTAAGRESRSRGIWINSNK